MRFVLDLWPDGSENMTPGEAVRYAIDRIRAAGEELTWELRSDVTDEVIAESVHPSEIQPSDAGRRYRVEVVHSRDPDSACGIQVWLGGERVPDDQVYVADMDPGSSGPPLSEWDEATDEIAKDNRLTPGFREAVVEERNAFRDSSWIQDDRPRCPKCSEPVEDGECLGATPHRLYNPDERFWVVDERMSGDEAVLRRFAHEQEAAEFIETLPEYETGRYGLDDMLLGLVESGVLPARMLHSAAATGPATAPTLSFVLHASGGHTSSHASKEDAIAYARTTLRAESFEVYDGDDRQVYAERPQPRWL